MTVTAQINSPFCPVGTKSSGGVVRMPADVTYLCSVSPPFVYNNNLLSQSFYTSPYNVLSSKPFNRNARIPVKPKALKPCIKAFQNRQNAPTYGGVNIAPQKLQQNSTPNVAKSKKRSVTFADTQGRALTLIKYLTESSYEPPKRLESGELLEGLVKNLSLGKNPTTSDNNATKLKVKFEQPVANYVLFKQRLEVKNVSLENLVVKDNGKLTGTVKVKNLAFNKTVSVRITFDDWKSHSDHQCAYVKNAYENGIFDTFQFDISIPPFFSSRSQQIQFCVNYRCDTAEYWDNNDGANYIIASPDYSASNAASPTSESAPIPIPQRGNCSYPSTYGELPAPEHNMWLNMENSGPFY
ncbi:protein phosphatase 1 regulatory subunit 3B-like [Clavelina lepadiformis]|uniref:CBM21 domain-containing protein n=1 Tax=Clavelina lepadiformis TaxID=159417 RepID=A0ABP0FMY6_CLALP